MGGCGGLRGGGDRKGDFLHVRGLGIGDWGLALYFLVSPRWDWIFGMVGDYRGDGGFGSAFAVTAWDARG